MGTKALAGGRGALAGGGKEGRGERKGFSSRNFFCLKKFVRSVRFVVTGSVCGAKRAPHTESNSRRELCKVCKTVSPAGAQGGGPGAADNPRLPRIKNLKDRMREWAPYHFLLMVEALREFRSRDEILPPGAQAAAGPIRM